MNFELHKLHAYLTPFNKALSPSQIKPTIVFEVFLILSLSIVKLEGHNIRGLVVCLAQKSNHREFCEFDFFTIMEQCSIRERI